MAYFIDIHTHEKTTINNSVDCNNFNGENDKIISIKNILLQNKIQTKGLLTVGLHPWDINNINEELLDNLESICKTNRVIAIGEVGLDRKTETPILKQLSILEKQILISEKLKLPVILHIVKYFDEIIKLRKSHHSFNPWIIHGFVKNSILAKQLLKEGFYLSFGASLFKKGSNSIESFKKADIDKVFLETDDNSEYDIQQIYIKAAEIKNIGLSELQKQIEINFKRVFTENDR